LQARYKSLDPVGASVIDMKNKRRLVRAIEVCLLTGRPFSEFRDQWKETPAAATGFVLTRERDDLYNRINRRVEEMFRDGVVEEVRAAGDAGATAAQAIGFKEIRAMIDGAMTLKSCIERVQQATRQYAKRQLTWFRSERSVFLEINLSLHTNTADIVQLIGQHATSTIARRDV